MPLAQWTEQWFSKPSVISSNLIRRVQDAYGQGVETSLSRQIKEVISPE